DRCLGGRRSRQGAPVPLQTVSALPGAVFGDQSDSGQARGRADGQGDPGASPAALRHVAGEPRQTDTGHEKSPVDLAWRVLSPNLTPSLPKPKSLSRQVQRHPLEQLTSDGCGRGRRWDRSCQRSPAPVRRSAKGKQVATRVAAWIAATRYSNQPPIGGEEEER